MLPDVQDTMEKHSHLPQAALQSKGPLLFPVSHCQAWMASDLRLCMNVISPGPGLLVPAHASGRFSPREPLAALETRAQVTLENVISLPRVKDDLSCCRLELEL